MDDLELPFTTSLGWVLIVFLSALVTFHFLFVWPRNLTKVGWKIVDYFWIAAALLGVIGSVGVARQAVAQNLLATASARLETFASGVESAVRFGTSGAICRRFVRTEFSPPPGELDRIQREFDNQCAWFKDALEKLKTSPLMKREILTLENLGNPPPKGGDAWALTSLRESLDRYNNAVANFKRLSEDTRRTELESLLTVVGPFLLAIALALRITKVSGEIRHEL